MSFSTFLKKYTIPFFVFVTGACVLIIEILATRILAPYFGNTIFSLSSVLSVVLLALSLGYFFGGKLADKYPKEEVFFSIITLSGLCTIFLHITGMAFLSAFGFRLSITQGPIISSILLFFVQNFLLGMLSPFAIKLQSARVQSQGIGTISGQVFFWSTLGSILGSLSAGFFLIPYFGINLIIISVGFLLLVLGLSSLLKTNGWLKLSFIIISVICYLVLIPHFFGDTQAKPTAYTRDGLYQKINIYDGQYQGQAARFLFLDRDASAAEFTNSPALAYEYTKYYAAYQVFNPSIRSALMIGGGGYSVPKALLANAPNVNIDVAEIEPSLLSLTQQYFGVPSSPRLHNFVEDGRRLLADSHKKYDFIFSDAYSSIYSTPSHLTTQEFFTLAQSRLNTNGVFMANVIGSLAPKKESLALSEIKTFKSVFKNSYFFSVVSPTSQALQNIIFIGYNGVNAIDFRNAQVRSSNNPIISGLAGQQINVEALDLSSHPTLTDDFSPIEYLTSKEL